MAIDDNVIPETTNDILIHTLIEELRGMRQDLRDFVDTLKKKGPMLLPEKPEPEKVEEKPDPPKTEAPKGKPRPASVRVREPGV